MSVMQMQHYVDPVEEIQERIGDLSEIIVPFNKLLVGIYMRPNLTKSGIVLPDQVRDEDRYQGKAGVILKKGPMAFKDDDHVKFHGLNPDVGDWIAFRPSNGMKIDIRSKDGHCILLSDTQVELVIPAPDMVF